MLCQECSIMAYLLQIDEAGWTLNDDYEFDRSEGGWFASVEGQGNVQLRGVYIVCSEKQSLANATINLAI